MYVAPNSRLEHMVLSEEDQSTIRKPFRQISFYVNNLLENYRTYQVVCCFNNNKAPQIWGERVNAHWQGKYQMWMW